MAIRTTVDLVKGIVEVDPLIDLTPFITVASSLVDQIALVTNPPDAARLTLIETWLSAHFYCMRDPRPVEEHAGPVGTTYQSKVDLNLALSHYGQMAMTLDTTGTLLGLSRGKRRGSVTWLGKEEDRGQVDLDR